MTNSLEKALLTLLLSFVTTAAVVAQNMFKGFVNIKDIDSTIVVDLMYAKADNFVGEKMYNFSEAYLHPSAARAVKKPTHCCKRVTPICD